MGSTDILHNAVIRETDVCCWQGERCVFQNDSVVTGNHVRKKPVVEPTHPFCMNRGSLYVSPSTPLIFIIRFSYFFTLRMWWNSISKIQVVILSDWICRFYYWILRADIVEKGRRNSCWNYLKVYLHGVASKSEDLLDRFKAHHQWQVSDAEIKEVSKRDC